MKRYILLLSLIIGLVSLLGACTPLAEEPDEAPYESELEENEVPVEIPASQIDTPIEATQPTNENAEQNQKTTMPLLIAVVTDVVDGDTIIVQLDDATEERIRFIGVDTPESTRAIEPFGKESAAFTADRLIGKTVYIELDASERDRFGSVLGYIWLTEPTDDSETQARENMFNAELLLQGYATTMTIPPNVKYAHMFIAFEREAREAQRSLWELSPAVQTEGLFVEHVDLRLESITIKNNNDMPVDISGWVLLSERGNQRFTFPAGTVIPASANIVVVSGPGAAAAENRILWTDASVWNNDGDPAVLLDADGNEVSRL